MQIDQTVSPGLSTKGASLSKIQLLVSPLEKEIPSLVVVSFCRDGLNIPPLIIQEREKRTLGINYLEL
jgi:hypothetical protein